MRINLTVSLLSIVDGNDADDATYDALSKAYKKHAKASNAFVNDLKAMDDATLSKCIASLAASWRLELNKSNALTYDDAAKHAADVHSVAKAVAATVRETLRNVDKTRDGFNKARECANTLRILDGFMVTLSNLIDAHRFIVSKLDAATVA